MDVYTWGNNAVVNARNKGAAFERKIVKMINDYCEEKGLEERVKRNLDQYQQKGQEDITWEKFAIECKCYAGDGTTFAQERWWKQACEAAGEDKIPFLIYKYNRNKERFVLPAWLIVEGIPKTNQSVMLGYLDDIWKDMELIRKNAHNL